MNIIRLLILFVLADTFTLHAQTTEWKWSIRRCEVSQPKDSAFLVDCEKKIWKASLTGACTVYMGMFGGDGYNVRSSKAEVENRFADSTVKKLVFPGGWELATLWNTAADSFRVISFEPNCALRDNRPANNRPMFSLETFCWAHIPLFDYRQVLNEKEMAHYRQLVVQSTARALGATVKGDTLFRKIIFRDDSNLYLPQASYTHLGTMMKNAIFSGKFHTYPTELLEKPMSKRQVEEAFVHWDSTNAVEDPNHPGVFILAPIKTEAQVAGVVVYEKWIPVALGYDPRSEREWQPKADLQYTRQVAAFGLLLTSGNVLWCSPPQFGTVFCSGNFNWFPYEECFRAERYQTMKIKTVQR